MELTVQQTPATELPACASNRRATARRPVAWPARLTWKDERGATRFVSVVARDVSDFGVYVECYSAVSIPLYRLVQLQFERDVRQSEAPDPLNHGRVLTAVYRVSSATAAGKPQGLALRLMVDPKRQPSPAASARATA